MRGVSTPLLFFLTRYLRQPSCLVKPHPLDAMEEEGHFEYIFNVSCGIGHVYAALDPFPVQLTPTSDLKFLYHSIKE